MAAGLLVGDNLVDSVVKQRLSEHDWNYGFIIDGFPRNERQAEFFLESYDIDGVIHLDLPDSEVARRVLARRLCAGCGMDYSLIDNSPSDEGRCDVCGGELIRREDDTEEALAVRLREYHGKTNPVLEIFRRKEYVITVDSRPGKQQVQQAIRDRLGLRPPAWRRRAARLARGSEHRPPRGPDRAGLLKDSIAGADALAGPLTSGPNTGMRPSPVLIGAGHPGASRRPPCQPDQAPSARKSCPLSEDSGAPAFSGHFQLVYAPDDEPGLIPDVTTAAGLLTFALVLITVT